MNININTNFKFRITGINYNSCGEIIISITSDVFQSIEQGKYCAVVSDGSVESREPVSLLAYARRHEQRTDIKTKTRLCYRLMCDCLEKYGDTAIDRITTGYLQGFITHLQNRGLANSTVRLHFQKLACVLHEAYKDGLFDERILLRVKRPRRDQQRRSFLTEAELRRLSKAELPDKYSNIRSMFLFSCQTGLRFGDIQALRWKDVKRSGNHLYLEFRQHKTDTVEKLPLSTDAETFLKSCDKKGGFVFSRESNQHTNTILKHWCKDARVKKDVSFHCARHTFCVLLLTKEVPIYTVQRLMCHSDIGTTKIYADLTGSTKSKALKKLPVLNASS